MGKFDDFSNNHLIEFKQNAGQYVLECCKIKHLLSEYINELDNEIEEYMRLIQMIKHFPKQRGDEVAKLVSQLMEVITIKIVNDGQVKALKNEILEMLQNHEQHQNGLCQSAKDFRELYKTDITFRFSENLKSQYLNCQYNDTVLKYSNDEQIKNIQAQWCLADRYLPLHQISKFDFLILEDSSKSFENNNNQFYLGICSKNINVSLKYHNLELDCYLISSSGVIHCSNQTDFIDSDIILGKGSLISFKFDPNKMELSISDFQNKYVVNILPTETELFPCVITQNRGLVVQILS